MNTRGDVQSLASPAAETVSRPATAHGVPGLRSAASVGWAVLRTLIWLAAALWMLLDFPIARLSLALVLAAYFVCVVRAPRVWLIVLPAAMTAIDLSAWSGRWLFTEVDMLVMVTLAALAWDRRPVRRSATSRGRRHAVVLLTVLAWCTSTAVGLDLSQPFDLAEFAAHRGPYEGLRAVKPVLYAVLLIGALRREFAIPHDAAARSLAAGFSLGLVCLGLWVLWDRGVFTHLVHWRDIYAFAEDLLDASASYRTTGPFAGMHTGGVAIDAYVLLAMPFALALLLYARGAAERTLALIGFGLGCYALVGTFTRSTYAGFALLLVIAALIWAARVRAQGLVSWTQLSVAILTLAMASVIALMLHAGAGYQALASGALAFAGGAVCLAIRYRTGWTASLVTMAGLVAITVLAAHQGAAESKWGEPPQGMALTALLFGVAALPALGWLNAHSLISALRPYPLAAVTGVLVLGWMLVVPAVSGYRMDARFSEAGQDFDGRMTHWRDSAALRGDGLVAVFFGAGAGSYARNYYWRHLGEPHVGSFQFVREPDESFLRLGAGDYNIMQRVAVEPGRRYRLAARMRSPDTNARVDFKLCHKNVLYSERHTPNCPVVRLTTTPGQGWQVLESSVDSGVLGRYGAAYWPVTLLIPHTAARITVDVTDVRLLDDSGRDLISNGDFSHGADQWFFVSDYSHLPWHVKNLPLHLWVEQGWFGVVAFLVLVVAVLARSWQLRYQSGLLPATLLAALPALGVLSLFGTIVDFPRIALLVYLVLFAGLYMPRATDATTSGRGSQRHRP